MFLFLSSVLVMSVFWEAECNQASSNTSFFPVVHGSLWSLDFSNRNLSSRDISCGTFKHSQLKYLNLSNNHLVMFPLCLPATLNVLDLSNNNISELTDHSFQDLLDLHTLILHHNNIIQVLLNTTLNLKVLDLSYNQLLSLPVTTNWSNLTYLSIAENQIENVYLNDLNTFQSLEHLNLSGNPLAYFNTSGMADASTGNLIELDIRNTNITNDTRCSYFQKLETLHMVRNQHLSHQEHSLKECMPTLSKVNFKNTNSLDTGNSKIFNILQELKFFSIKNLSTVDSANTSSSNTTKNDNKSLFNCKLGLCLLLSTPGKNLERYEASTSASIQNALDNTGTIRTDGTTISAVKETAKSAASETTTGMTTETTLVTTVTYTHMGQEKTTSIRTNGTPNSPNSESTKAAASETTKTAATEIKIAASATPKATLESPKHSPLSNLTTPFQQFDFGTDEYESDDLPSKHDQFNPQLVTCDYDPCRDLQIPCLDLQKLHKCLCPGMSTAAIRPNPPMLKEASEITYTSANIHWCAPYSAVSEYQLKVEREDGLVHLNDHIHETFRRFTVYGLPAGTTHSVCVAAKNKAGTSDEVCTTFKTEHDYTIFMYAFATATGLLLLVAIVLAVCLYKRSKNPPPELPYLTNSISIQNPAFSHPMGKYDFSNNI